VKIFYKKEKAVNDFLIIHSLQLTPLSFIKKFHGADISKHNKK
jgi:hypothetical protein